MISATFKSLVESRLESIEPSLSVLLVTKALAAGLLTSKFNDHWVLLPFQVVRLDRSSAVSSPKLFVMSNDLEKGDGDPLVT